MLDNLTVNVDGHVKIWDPETQEIFVDKHNAINSEAMSVLIADAMSGKNASYISEMHFGNGGTAIDETGNITYRDVTVSLENGIIATLFNATYFKVVDALSIDNTEPLNNKVETSHTQGLNYTDVIITCTLNKDEPAIGSPFNLTSVDQADFDTASDFDGEFIFDELGLKSRSESGDLGDGILLSHIVFHPVQKSKNRTIQVVYTLRIRIV